MARQVEATDNLYRFFQGNSVVAKRSAVLHATGLVDSEDPEALLAVSDLDLVRRFAACLSSTAESILTAELLRFFLQIETLSSSAVAGDAGRDGPGCHLRAHHKPPAVARLAALLLSPSVGPELRTQAAQLLQYIQPPRSPAPF